MEKSIEDIWKSGFASQKEIVIPKIEDLYNRKSIHIMDKILRMGRFNVWMLISFSVVMPLYGFLSSQPIWISIVFFFLFAGPAVYTHYKLKELKDLDLADNSYQYLLNLRNWLRNQFKTNLRYSKFYYPLALFAAASMIWFAKGREELTSFLILNDLLPFSTMEVGYLFWGLAGLIALLMIIFSKKIYKFDVNLLYGNLFKKLNEIISDMEEMKG